MKRRNNWTHDKCPLCLAPNKTVTHVTACRDPRARLQWTCSINLLGVALGKAKTNPSITTVIQLRLAQLYSRTWSALPAGLPTEVKRAAAEQDSLGWLQFLRGRVSKGWEDAQERWLVSITTKWKRSSARWMSKLLKIWEVSFEMWEHRNRVLHNPSHPWNLKKTRDRDARITAEIAAYREPAYLKKDQRLFNHTAEHLLSNYSDEQKEQWLESVAVARMRKMGTRSKAMTSLRLLMQHWLVPTAAQEEEATE